MYLLYDALTQNSKVDIEKTEYMLGFVVFFLSFSSHSEESYVNSRNSTIQTS